MQFNMSKVVKLNINYAKILVQAPNEQTFIKIVQFRSNFRSDLDVFLRGYVVRKHLHIILLNLHSFVIILSWEKMGFE